MLRYLNFLKEVYQELKKVVWPSKELVRNATLVVIVFTLLVAIYLWGLDLLFSKLITFIVER
ncbi:MAG: preprotein translocase subunit SecE [Hydrogenothermaceae bacterium]|nr:preprotein translocase subunit SecE [Hydrogenothermaceae bacterium]